MLSLSASLFACTKLCVINYVTKSLFGSNCSGSENEKSKRTSNYNPTTQTIQLFTFGDSGICNVNLKIRVLGTSTGPPSATLTRKQRNRIVGDDLASAIFIVCFHECHVSCHI